MYFYRPLHSLSVISFDLDDTLYDNRPVIARTERESLDFIQRYHPALRELRVEDLQHLRAELGEQDPEICHDVTEWRWQSVRLALTRRGLSRTEAEDGADAAMENFARWRSCITVPQETHDTLSALAQRWPLVAITNGNANPDVCGLGGYFAFTLRAGPHGRAKPWRDMYHAAADRLGIPLRGLLHVGDDLITDVAGALRCGAQSCWINDRERDLLSAPDSRLLPHLEISRLASLTALL
ncbi:5-amino-6-(5-phospho-D-ribitylamino)uracil phosphatase YigB [Affinibrenneria salicis]|uniref:5-amino-6-(5-phospho-D-ribitylamino)uracil phosphatase YigB n=1 Tax=Affinibrenneria salicis TaxID=2590031 RepID=A0A5J5FSP4_9GAMM|nr:5-amino-6-(5-phospho-D-ribitylamino)uracil phosphatase YigB [Affinibrenneria salicis]KAA8996431.1 5-amino-6-(5-phospho-D-ribitylamino)uracil phosphatase YigB [Affinibrenneria salicis]